jgi:hypothetical protein
MTGWKLREPVGGLVVTVVAEEQHPDLTLLPGSQRSERKRQQQQRGQQRRR